MTLLIYNQETKRTDITDKHQPTSTFLSKFNPEKPINSILAIQVLLKEKKKLNIFKPKLLKEIIINSKIYISSHTVIEMNKFFFSLMKMKN